MIDMPDHEDGKHVPFPEAMGYGVSTILNWMAYILVIAILNVIIWFIITLLLAGAYAAESELGMWGSFLLAFVAAFTMFVLTFALVVAIGYKFWSDVGMKAASAIDFGTPTGRGKKAYSLVRGR
jgi:hypothetical protein